MNNVRLVLDPVVHRLIFGEKVEYGREHKARADRRVSAGAMDGFKRATEVATFDVRFEIERVDEFVLVNHWGPLGGGREE